MIPMPMPSYQFGDVQTRFISHCKMWSVNYFFIGEHFPNTLQVFVLVHAVVAINFRFCEYIVLLVPDAQFPVSMEMHSFFTLINWCDWHSTKEERSHQHSCANNRYIVYSMYAATCECHCAVGANIDFIKA